VKLKDRASFFSFTEWSQPHINKWPSWREEFVTISNNKYADCPPNIANMFPIKNSNILLISVSENLLVVSECFFLYKGLSLPKIRYSRKWNWPNHRLGTVLFVRIICQFMNRKIYINSTFWFIWTNALISTSYIHKLAKQSPYNPIEIPRVDRY